MAKIFCKDCEQYLGETGIMASIGGGGPIDGMEFKDGWRCKECGKKKKLG